MDLAPVQRRVVVIAGRPNVGKSTIFNRLAGRRIAIVHSERGVTRDRLVCEVSWKDERFDLVDTGGITTLDSGRAADSIEDGVRRQVDAALLESSVVILAVDITAGIVPLDEEAARLVRLTGKPIIVAANKADHPSRDRDTAEFERLGFPVFPVSAEQNRGFDALMKAVLAAMPPAVPMQGTEPLRVAVVGRPNVGKSSYINRLLRCDRVIVSPVPGTTRDSISVPFVIGKGIQARHYELIDTAGLRRGSKVDNVVEQFSQDRTEKSIEAANVVVLILDTVQGPTAQDKKIADLILEHRKGCVLIVNKWDLAKGIAIPEYVSAVHRAMPFMDHCPILCVSAQAGFNVRQSVEAVDHVAAQTVATLSTGLLNRVVGIACDRVQAPPVGNRRLKVFYLTQVGKAPVTLQLFVNDPLLVKPAYKEYLVRELRARFGLEGAPVVMRFVSRGKTEKGAGRRAVPRGRARGV